MFMSNMKLSKLNFGLILTITRHSSTNIQTPSHDWVFDLNFFCYFSQGCVASTCLGLFSGHFCVFLLASASLCKLKHFDRFVC